MIPQNYQDIRDYVKTALAERQSAKVPEAFRPSKYWEYFNDHSRYVRDLPDAELKRIRRHTFHLTGDIYQTYLLNRPAFFQRMERDYRLLDARIADSGLGEDSQDYGYEFNGKRISVDLLRYLQVLGDLTESGVLKSQEGQCILEIGGGYGGLASTTMRYNPRTTYLLCDLEETLFFQAVHLSNQFGFSAVELCQSDFSVRTQLKPGRFCLVPQSRFSLLEGRLVDLVVNQQSMQEMNQHQALRYFEHIKRAARWFYSCNAPHDSEVARRTEIVGNVCELMDGYFDNVLWKRMPRKMAPNGKLPRWKKILGRRLRNAFSNLFTKQSSEPDNVGDWQCHRKVYVCRGGDASLADGARTRAAAA